MSKKEYNLIINTDEKQLELLKGYMNSILITYGFEEVKDDNIVDKTIAFYYTNGYIDNCVLFNNNIVDIERFIEIYPTITPMYSFKIDNIVGFELLNNYVGKELTDEIISYCKRLYNDKLK